MSGEERRITTSSASAGASDRNLRTRAKALEAVDEVGRLLAAELDLAKLVQAITDATTRLTEAEFGAFCHNIVNERGEAHFRCTLSGVSEEDFSALRQSTALFGPTPSSNQALRLDDVTDDPRYGQHGATGSGATSVRSYLAAPVISRNREVLGGLYFAHSAAGRFTEDHERLLSGIARYAAIAIDNARLYERAREGELANSRLAAIVQSSDDAIVGKNLDGIVQSWNGGAERMFGFSAQEMIGQSITKILPEDRLGEEASILARLRRGERVDHFETVRRTKQGRAITISVTISPIRDAEGRIVGASKVARDITGRKRADAEREQLLAAEQAARAEAERHSRMKDEFLATLGHELRTPLNAVLGWASMLRKEAPGSEEISHGLAVIERNARLQAQLIEDLLDMSRIVSGKIRLSVQPVDLSAVIQAALESVRPAADAKQVRVHCVLDPLAGAVSGDPARLQQVIWNLLSNAVKFTPKGGRVQVVLERINSHVEISVADTGEGIPPEFLPLVFDRFRQIDASTTRQHGGLGLGLAIVKHLVELHGGSVHARSPGLGYGATFTVKLPVRAMRGDSSQSGSPTGVAAVSSMANEISLAGLRAMVVDDEPDARDLVRRMLEGAGAQVRTAGSASEAFAAIREEPPEILISDIGMPGEDGYSLVRRLRALPKDRGGQIPAVALTAFARADDRRRALLSGFQMHVPKPVEAPELLAVIASVTRRV